MGPNDPFASEPVALPTQRHDSTRETSPTRSLTLIGAIVGAVGGATAEIIGVAPTFRILIYGVVGAGLVKGGSYLVARLNLGEAWRVLREPR